MADDGAHEETVVRDLGAHLHAGGAQIQVHLVVGARDGGERKVAHAVQFQLEGQRRLQVPVDPIFFELEANTKPCKSLQAYFSEKQEGEKKLSKVKKRKEMGCTRVVLPAQPPPPPSTPHLPQR